MFKINIMQIMKFITAVVCFSLFGFAVYSMNQSKASPLPFLICACILYVVDGIYCKISPFAWKRPCLKLKCTMRPQQFPTFFFARIIANKFNFI